MLRLFGILRYQHRPLNLRLVALVIAGIALIILDTYLKSGGLAEAAAKNEKQGRKLIHRLV